MKYYSFFDEVLIIVDEKTFEIPRSLFHYHHKQIGPRTDSILLSKSPREL